MWGGDLGLAHVSQLVRWLPSALTGLLCDMGQQCCPHRVGGEAPGIGAQRKVERRRTRQGWPARCLADHGSQSHRGQHAVCPSDTCPASVNDRPTVCAESGALGSKHMEHSHRGPLRIPTVPLSAAGPQGSHWELLGLKSNSQLSSHVTHKFGKVLDFSE